MVYRSTYAQIITYEPTMTFENNTFQIDDFFETMVRRIIEAQSGIPNEFSTLKDRFLKSRRVALDKSEILVSSIIIPNQHCCH